ncbi:MAG: TetR/AcrR family transcriptional regulator [Emcibacter sp.]|nr:TetR/AcrR family transcriptional regulator [Emcibacter sp.]
MSQPLPTKLSRAEARRLAFLEAAEKIFLTHGYSAANIKDVIQLASGSMATLYSQFGNKEGLFEALVEHHIKHLRNPLEQLDVSEKSIQDGLIILGKAYLNAVLHPSAVSVYRLVVAESRIFPDLMKKIGSNRWHIRDSIMIFLQKRIQAGEIREVQVELVATCFLDMLRGQHLAQAIYEPNYQINEKEMSEFVTQAVDLLCQGLLAHS